MKLDATDVRYLSGDVYRVLTAVEMGSKNHEVVPSSLIAQISNMRNGNVNKCLGELAKKNLVARVQGAKYDGYRLTYGGYDYLAMRTLAKRDAIFSVGNQIGTGKESDIYVVADQEENQLCCKIHRLGRISFRQIKSKRDYLRKGQSASWMYLSRLSAQKEYAFMQILHQHGFPVPKPIDQARHCVVMELIDAFPLRQIAEVGDPGALYSALMDLIVRLAKSGLIHGDFNEFNILLRETEDGEPEPILIDFPQMVSTEHENAEYYFNRDVACIRQFFRRKFNYESTVYPRFATEVKDGVSDFRLDVEVEASGWKKGTDDHLALDEYYQGLERQDDQSEGDDRSEHDELEESSSLENDFEGIALNTSDHEGHSTSASNENPTSSHASEEENENEDDDEEDDEEEEEEEANETASPRKPKSKRHAKEDSNPTKDVAAIVSTSLVKEQRHAQRRFHSKKSVKKDALGRSKGSKGKTDARRNISEAQHF